MTGGSSSSSSSSSTSPSPQTNPRQQHHPPPLTIPPSSTHNGLPPATTTTTPKPKPPPPPQQQPPPLLLTVRFSTSIPDLLLDIPRPHTTTVAALKHLIRSRLDAPDARRRLRFIHGGKILPDAAVLSAVLKVLLPPPAPQSTTTSSTSTSARDDDAYGQDPKGKGKGKAVDGPGGAGHQRVYVNCSIGDHLTDAELRDEKQKAAEPPPAQSRKTAASPPPTGSLSGPFRSGTQRHTPGGGAGGSGSSSATPTPRGFDRLLSTGFTAAEVNQLRLQFRSIQGARHTADTMPSPDTLRGMEDAWIDNNNDAGTGLPGGSGGQFAGGGGGDGADGGGEDGGGGGAGGEEFGIAGVLDVLLVGMLVGFVWPLGAVGWLVRDEEKISKRMRVFMYLGFVFSLLIGTVRAIG